MDNSMGLVSAILVISVFLPFFYAAFLGSGRKRYIKNRVRKTLAAKGAVLVEQEFWGDNFIGLNAEKTTLYFINFNGKEMVLKEIGVTTLQSCEIIKNLEKEKDKGMLLLQLYLELTFAHNGGKKLLLKFYDRAEARSEDYEEERAKRWKAILLTQRVRGVPSRSVA